MINTIEEAKHHSKHINAKNIVVLPDGQIYHGGEELQKIIDSTDCFIVKGNLVRTEKVKIKKQKETNE